MHPTSRAPHAQSEPGRTGQRARRVGASGNGKLTPQPTARGPQPPSVCPRHIHPRCAHHLHAPCPGHPPRVSPSRSRRTHALRPHARLVRAHTPRVHARVHSRPHARTPRAPHARLVPTRTPRARTHSSRSHARAPGLVCTHMHAYVIPNREIVPTRTHVSCPQARLVSTHTPCAHTHASRPHARLVRTRTHAFVIPKRRETRAPRRGRRPSAAACRTAAAPPGAPAPHRREHAAEGTRRRRSAARPT